MRRFTHVLGTVALITLVIGFAAPAFAAPDEGPPPCDCYECGCREPTEPTCPLDKYAVRRFDETWRPCLCVPCCDKGDWSDAWKGVPLTANRSIWANFGGQARLRFESFNEQGFGAAGSDATDDWLLARFRTHADIHFGENVRVFVEGIYANQHERELGPRPIDVNEGDLLNAFIEVSGAIGGAKAGLWVGRHELLLGQQRLVGPLDWANTRRTFQGIGGHYTRGFHRFEAFATHPVAIDRPTLDDDWNEDVSFWGLTYTNSSCDCLTWDVWLLGLSRDSATYSGVTDDEDRYTIAALAKGKIAGTRLDFDAALGYQFGSFGSGDISAGFVAAELGWAPCMPCYEPRFALGVDWSSGDDDPTDSDVGTFNQLFPTGHKFYGANDLLGRQNLLAIKAEVAIKPMKKVTLKSQVHAFWRASDDDAAYNVAGGVLRAAPTNDEKHLGWSIDLLAKYAHDRHWSFLAGYSHFFVGDFIESTGADDDVDFFFVSAQFTF